MRGPIIDQSAMRSYSIVEEQDGPGAGFWIACNDVLAGVYPAGGPYDTFEAARAARDQMFQEDV